MSQQRRRAAMQQKRAAQRKKQRTVLIAAAAAIIIIIVIICVSCSGGKKDAAVSAQTEPSAETVETVETEITDTSSEDTDWGSTDGIDSASDTTALGDFGVEGEIAADETFAQTESADNGTDALTLDATDTTETTETTDTTETVESNFNADGTYDRSNNAQYRPTAEDGFMPVFSKSGTQEKIIAITVDDCFQADNMREIMEIVMQYGGKLTFFPIGKNAIRTEQSEILREALANGMEIENHTFTHNGLYSCSDEDLAKEIYVAEQALSYVLNVNYTCHFLRPMGGDARNDQRIHAYIKQRGNFYGIAHWSVETTSRGIKTVCKGLAPGAIYLFHTTDNDLENIKQFVPYAYEQGYRFVTLNEMFGYPDNETSELTEPIVYDNIEVPQLQDYDMIYVTLKKGTYLYAVKLLQNRLYELGWIDEEGDGIYGDGTVEAVKEFQLAAGLTADGIAGAETQTALYADTAPKKMT